MQRQQHQQLILTPDPRVQPLAQSRSQTEDDGLDLLLRERDVRTETSANDEPVVPAISVRFVPSNLRIPITRGTQ
jgi:hypothetical protein